MSSSNLEYTNHISSGSYGTLDLAKVTFPHYEESGNEQFETKLCVVKHLYSTDGAESDAEVLKEVIACN